MGASPGESAYEDGAKREGVEVMVWGVGPWRPGVAEVEVALWAAVMVGTSPCLPTGPAWGLR